MELDCSISGFKCGPDILLCHNLYPELTLMNLKFKWYEKRFMFFSKLCALHDWSEGLNKQFILILHMYMYDKSPSAFIQKNIFSDIKVLFVHLYRACPCTLEFMPLLWKTKTRGGACYFFDRNSDRRSWIILMLFAFMLSCAI